MKLSQEKWIKWCLQSMLIEGDKMSLGEQRNLLLITCFVMQTPKFYNCCEVPMCSPHSADLQSDQGSSGWGIAGCAFGSRELSSSPVPVPTQLGHLQCWAPPQETSGPASFGNAIASRSKAQTQEKCINLTLSTWQTLSDCMRAKQHRGNFSDTCTENGLLAQTLSRRSKPSNIWQ